MKTENIPIARRWAKRLTGLLLGAVMVLSASPAAHAAIEFNGDQEFEVDQDGIIIGIDSTGANDTTIQFGLDGTASENGILKWDVTNNEFDFDHSVNITGGLEASGNVNFGAASEFHMRQVADEAAATCTTVDELVLDTTENTIYVCTAVGTPGTWTNTASASGTDLQGAYDADGGGAHEILVSGSGNAVEIRANGNGDQLLELQNSAAANLLQLSDLGGNTIDMNTQNVDWDTTGNLAIDATGTFSVDGDGPSNVTVGSDSAGEDLTLSVTGATDSSVSIQSSGTGTDAVNIDTTAGGIEVDSAAGLSLDGVTSSNLTVTGNSGATETLTINATNAGAGDGAVTVSSDGAITFDDGSLTTPVTVSEAGETAIDAEYGSNSIVGALNKLADFTAGDGADVVGIENGSTANLGLGAGSSVQDAIEAIDTALGGSAGANNEQLVFHATYPDVVVSEDGTNNRGRLDSEYDSTDDRNYYQWSTRRGTSQDIDLRFRFVLPADFTDVNDLNVEFRTGTATLAENAVDITMFEVVGGANTQCATSTNNNGTAWANITLNEAAIEAGCAALAAGDTVEVLIKLDATNAASAFARVGTISLGYDN